MQPPRRQEPLEDLAEADEKPGADHPRDLAGEALVPAELVETPLEQPGEADVVGEVFDLPGLALAGRGVLGELLQIAGQGIVGQAELAQQRAMHDQVGVPANRGG